VRAYAGTGRGETLSPPETRTIRVVLADDESLFVEALAALLDLDARIDVVGRARDGLEALRLAAMVRPDVVLMDLGMARINGIGATRILRSDYPSVQVVIVTASSAPEDVDRAREAGAAAYVTKDRLTELADTLVEVVEIQAAEEFSQFPWGQRIPGTAVSRTAVLQSGSS
jgi:DNA-binding NarL/FixJ family response regulator